MARESETQMIVLKIIVAVMCVLLIVAIIKEKRDQIRAMKAHEKREDERRKQAALFYERLSMNSLQEKGACSGCGQEKYLLGVRRNPYYHLYPVCSDECLEIVQDEINCMND